MDPTFSIIIPSKDRPEMLGSCLAALTRLDFPAEDFEVLVVDDASQEPLADASRPFTDQLPIHFLRQPAGGPAAARNSGAESARGRYLIFLDDDCLPGPGWLTAYQEGFDRSAANALVGSTLNPDPAVIGAQAWCLVQAFQYAYWRDQGGYLKIGISNNLAVERQAFFDVGGFDAAFPAAAAEDRDFSWRFNEAGWRIGHQPAAVVWHSQPSLGFFPYLKLQYRYGYYAGLQSRKQRPATAAEFSRRFGSRSRLRYALHLARFAADQQAAPREIAVLYLGHLAHYLGRIRQALSIPFKQ